MMISSSLKRLNNRFYPKKIFFGPEWLVLGVNNVCNLHCKMCDVGLNNIQTNFAVNLTGTHPLNMPLELIKQIMDQAHKFYPKSKIGYAFTEPLIYTHLIESLHYATTKNLYTSITTNALTLKQKAKDLVSSGLDEIFISLDGPEEIHNDIRGNKKSFHNAVEGINALLELDKRPEISIFCAITEWNIGHLKELADYFKTYPLKQMGFMHMNYTKDETALQHNHMFGHNYPATSSSLDISDLNNIKLDVLLEEINEIKSTSYSFPLTFSPELHDVSSLELFYHKPEIKIGRTCNDVYRNIMIKSDGSVIPAHGRCYNKTIGNIYESSLKEIWNSEVLSSFRKTLQKNGGLLPACTRCCSAF